MSANTTFSTALVGQVESAFGAILDRQLAGTGLGAQQWVTLTVAVANGGSVERDQLIRTIARARRINESQAQAYIADLVAVKLMDAPDEEGAPVTVTDAGRELQRRISTAVGEITHRLWGDLASEDLDTAARVLGTVLARANQELAGA